MEKIIVSCLESRIETNQSVYARFLLGPFTDDHAVTIGTALRRALLSKVKGIAITAIHIQGITHEFSNIIGVRESVLDLALNFQQIVLRPQKINRIKAPRVRKDLSQLLHLSQAKFTHLPSGTKEHQKKSSFYKNLPVSDKRKPFLSLGYFGKIEKRSWNVQEFYDKDRRKSTFSSTKSSDRENREGINIHTKDMRTKSDSFGLDESLYVRTYKPNLSTIKTPIPEVLSETPQIGYLQVRGPAIIYANDLKLPLGVECVDPTQYIATLSTEGSLVIKFLIGKENVFFFDDNGAVMGKSFRTQSVSKSNASTKTSFLYGRDTIRKTHTKSSTFKELLEDKVKLESTDLHKVGNLLQEQGSSNLSDQSFPLSQKVKEENGYSTFTQRPDLLSKEKGKDNIDKSKANIQSDKGITKNSVFNTSSSFAFADHFNGFDSSSEQKDAIALQHSTDWLRNTIFLDPIFNSVSQVNYIIEKDDLSNQPRERIVLELWTNGSIHPRQALHQASLSLVSTFSIFRKMFHFDSW